MTSHCTSPVSQVYVPESSGTRLWIRSWWDAPLFLRSYFRPAWMATLFLFQVTVALGSEMVQASVTVSPSNATVLCGFSSISTGSMGNPKLDLIVVAFICSLLLFSSFYGLGITNFKAININTHMHAVTIICYHKFDRIIYKDQTILSEIVDIHHKETKLWIVTFDKLSIEDNPSLEKHLSGNICVSIFLEQTLNAKNGKHI